MRRAILLFAAAALAVCAQEVYKPKPLLAGGIVVPLYSPDSPYLNHDKLSEPEQYSVSQSVPERVNSIVHIHNPSIEVHLVDKGVSTGAAVILIPGGGHRTLNVGSEGTDLVPFFYNYGVATVILRNRLRSDGYDVQKDAVRDAQEAVRLVRQHAAEWRIDPQKIGVMGFSAGAELAAAAAVEYRTPEYRPDFAALVYPGPSPFAAGRVAPAVPKDAPPAFVVCGGTGDKVHAIWAMEYVRAMLDANIPNVELHIYGNGRHPGDHMTGGITDRGGIPFGTWEFRFIDWFRDLGFLKPR